jgi:very-short-patch-repair endonuclease
MSKLFSTLESHGGFARKRFLVAHGATDAQIRAAFRSGRIFRIRHGWYALPQQAKDVEEAMRVGGILAGPSAASSYGVWTVASTELHVSVRKNSCRLRMPSDHRQRFLKNPNSRLTVYWDQTHQRPNAGVFRVPLSTAILQIYHRRGEDEAIASIDSALHNRLLSSRQLEIAELPRSVLELADARAESGIESMARIRLRRINILSQLQVEVPGVGRVDLVVGDRLVIELDGEEFHSGPKEFAADRVRDAKLTSLGFIVLRFSYDQVVHDWESVEAAVRAIVDAGLHLVHPN